jgi:5-methylcytosine-specific restriction endonuclease McrA
MGYANYNSEMNRYMKERYHRRREYWKAALGGECAECGSTDDLEFDHIVAEEKSYPIAKILSGGSEKKVAEEMAKCQLLCRPHHIEKSRIDIPRVKQNNASVTQSGQSC